MQSTREQMNWTKMLPSPLLYIGIVYSLLLPFTCLWQEISCWVNLAYGKWLLNLVPNCPNWGAKTNELDKDVAFPFGRQVLGQTRSQLRTKWCSEDYCTSQLKCKVANPRVELRLDQVKPDLYFWLEVKLKINWAPIVHLMFSNWPCLYNYDLFWKWI